MKSEMSNMIQKLKNKMVVGAVMLGAVGATFLAGGVANADPIRDGRGNDGNRVVEMRREHNGARHGGRFHHHHHRFNAVRGANRDCR